MPLTARPATSAVARQGGYVVDLDKDRLEGARAMCGMAAGTGKTRSMGTGSTTSTAVPGSNVDNS